VYCTAADCAPHAKYNHSLSSSYIPNGEPFKLKSTNLDMEGFLSVDTFTIAGLVVKNQTFAEGTYFAPSQVYITAPFDGILGLAFQAASTAKIVPLWQNMLNEKLITNSYFSIWLNSGTINPLSSGGEIYFGGIDSSKYSGTILYVPVGTFGLWQFLFADISINGVKENLCAGGGCNASLDSGSPFIIGPTASVGKLNKALGFTQASNGSGEYTIDCVRVNSLQNVAFIIGGVSYVLSPQQYVIQELGHCISGFFGLDNEYEGWVVGVVFIRAYYSVYDFGLKRIGFATAKQSIAPPITIH